MPDEVSGWRPEWMGDSTAVAARHRDRLRRMRGQRIEATRLVWIVDLDE